MKKKFLLIGGAGFIGSNLAKCFIKDGIDVTFYDLSDRPFYKLDKNCVTYVRGDYFNEEIDKELLKGFNVVILLACSVGPKSSMDVPEICYNRDVVKTIELLERMKECQLNRLVFISSGGTVYGDNDIKYLTEDMPTFPINHYGIMKLTQEKIILMYNQIYGMNNIIFRLANPYGPGQKVSSGVGVITNFIDHILNDKEVYIYGRGEAVRDYIYIDDVAQIINLFLKEEYMECEIPIYNVGTGQGTSLIEVISIIEELTEKKAKINFFEQRNIDVKHNVLKMDKIFSIIGEYKCLSVKEGIQRFLNLQNYKEV